MLSRLGCSFRKCKRLSVQTFAFEDMKDAYTYLQEGRHFGKVCVKV